MGMITEDRTIKISWSTAWMSQFELFGIDFLGLGRSGSNPWWIPAPVLAEANSDQGSVNLVFENASVPEDGFWMCTLKAGINITHLKGTMTEAEVSHPWRSIFTIPASETYREITFNSWSVSVAALVAEINKLTKDNLPLDYKWKG